MTAYDKLREERFGPPPTPSVAKGDRIDWKGLLVGIVIRVDHNGKWADIRWGRHRRWVTRHQLPLPTPEYVRVV